MAMQSGGTSAKAAINVTPMIDILLVLLITFMLIIPDKTKGLSARIPQPPDQNPATADAAPPPNQIVISVKGEGRVEINSQPVTIEELVLKLKSIVRPGLPIFVQGAVGIAFREVAEVIDAARGAGATEFALLPAS
jgi:biopolymer transport protein TolR